MTQEDKNILLQDLCARLPYGVKICYEAVIQFPEGEVLESIDITTNIVSSKSVVADFEDVKPYLFPMSSMTEEQLYEITELFDGEIDFSSPGVIELSTFYRNKLGCVEMLSIVEWFLKNHFDIRGLIPKGLAIDATGLNIY